MWYICADKAQAKGEGVARLVNLPAGCEPYIFPHPTGLSYDHFPLNTLAERSNKVIPTHASQLYRARIVWSGVSRAAARAAAPGYVYLECIAVRCIASTRVQGAAHDT